MATTLSGIRACVFDAYGTLSDYASAAAGCRDLLGEHLAPLTALWRETQLQYTLGCVRCKDGTRTSGR